MSYRPHTLFSTKDDLYFLGLANFARQRSKDPRTKVGAVIVRPDRTTASTGYNGFPRGVADDMARLKDRPTKHLFTVHAEANAIVTAREPLHGYTIYVTPMHPCACCAGLIAQSGIARVVAHCADIDTSAWNASFEVARTIFDEAGVAVSVYDRIAFAAPKFHGSETSSSQEDEQLVLV
jgi:dCMP deaminase